MSNYGRLWQDLKTENFFPAEAVERNFEIICIHLKIPYNCRVNEDGNG